MRKLLFAAALSLVSFAPQAARAQGAQDVGDTTPPPPPAEDEYQGPPPPEALPPAQPPDPASFDAQLSPYGRWVDTPDYGRVWVPSSTVDSGWQPYTDGTWVYTDGGWAFASSVPWGAIVFHYGRWGWREGMGWFWVPGTVWAPAWVSWRYTEGHIAWAPYAPRGFVYGPRWHGWVAVPREHFTHPIAREMIPRAHAGAIIRQSRPAPSIVRAPEHGHFYGPPHSVAPRPVPHAGAVPPHAGAAPPHEGEQRR